MANIKETHKLIQSLNKQEKIQLKYYFNAFEDKKKKNYFSDYQCFLKQKDFDKEKIIKALNQVEARQNLSKSNTDLYNFLIDFLVKINQNKQKKLTLLKEVQSIEFLFDKALFEQAESKIRGLKKKATKLESDTILFYLLELETKLLLHKPQKKDIYDVKNQLIAEQISFLEKTKLKLEFRQAKKKLFQLASKIGTPRTKGQQEKFSVFEKQAIFNIELNKLPKNVIGEYAMSKAMLSMVSSVGTPEKTLKILDDSLSILKEDEEEQKYITSEFLIRRMALEVAVFSKNKATIEKYFDKFVQLEPLLKSDMHKKLFTSEIHWAKLFQFLYLKEYQQGYEYVENNLEQILATGKEKKNPHGYIIYLSSARICFLAKDYEKSLFFIDLLIERKDFIRKSLLPHIYSLQLLNHYKLNNTDFLPYVTRSIYESILKSKQLYAPEKALLHFIRKSEKKADIKQELKKLYDKLTILNKDPLNASFFGNGDYLVWLEAEVVNS